MFQSVRRAVVQGVEKTWHTLAAHTGEGKGDNLWDKESNLYRRDILVNGQLLGENVDVEVRIEAIRKIGILAYTGGLDAGKLAGMYLERMVMYFQDATAPPPLRLQVIKSVAEMCRSHKDNVQTIIDLGLAEDIIARLRTGSDFGLVRWGCYTIVCLCSVSLVILKSVQSNYGDEELKKKLQVLSDLSWHAWPRNYAAVLMGLIGFTTSQADDDTYDVMLSTLRVHHARHSTTATILRALLHSFWGFGFLPFLALGQVLACYLTHTTYDFVIDPLGFNM